MKSFERNAPNFLWSFVLRSCDGIPTCPQIVLWNLAVWKDVATVQVEILVEVKGWDDPCGVALGPIQVIPNHLVEMPTAHMQGFISWILRHIKVDLCGQTSFQVLGLP